MLVFVFVIFFVAVVLDFQASFLVVERTNSLCSRRFTVRFYCSLRPFQVRRSSIAILPDLENLEQFIITKKRQPTNNGRVFWLYKLFDRLGLTRFGVSNMNWTIYREKRVEFSLKFSHSLDNLSSLLCRRRGRCFSSTYFNEYTQFPSIRTTSPLISWKCDRQTMFIFLLLLCLFSGQFGILGVKMKREIRMFYVHVGFDIIRF